VWQNCCNPSDEDDADIDIDDEEDDDDDDIDNVFSRFDNGRNSCIDEDDDDDVVVVVASSVVGTGSGGVVVGSKAWWNDKRLNLSQEHWVPKYIFSNWYKYGIRWSIKNDNSSSFVWHSIFNDFRCW